MTTQTDKEAEEAARRDADAEAIHILPVVVYVLAAAFVCFIAVAIFGPRLIEWLGMLP